MDQEINRCDVENEVILHWAAVPCSINISHYGTRAVVQDSEAVKSTAAIIALNIDKKHQ